MKITEIKPCRKHETKVVADGEEFLLDSETVLLYSLKEGMDIDRSALEKLKAESDFSRAKSRALWYLSRADHSKAALYKKLCRAYDSSAAEKAVARMEEMGLIDDFQYAQNLSTALRDANVSDREIMRKLFAKGVPSDIAKQVVEELDSNPQSQIAELIVKKYARKLETEEGVQKVYAALMRKGFSYGDVKAALREYSENLDNCEEI